jgi:hypothetical protein
MISCGQLHSKELNLSCVTNASRDKIVAKACGNFCGQATDIKSCLFSNFSDYCCPLLLCCCVVSSCCINLSAWEFKRARIL